MKDKKQLTTISQFGARLGLAKIHVKKLFESCSSINTNHIFYLVDSENIKLSDFLKTIENKHDNVKVYSKNDNNYTDFRRLKKKAPYGGDCNYDFLIRCSETKDVFLTLHDDSIIESSDLYADIMDILEHNQYGGYLDSRSEIKDYARILLDGKRMTDLRIGTWFFFGLKKDYLNSQYKVGVYKNFWKYYLYYKYNFSNRLLFKSQRVWLNGGFDFNIRARLEGKNIYIINQNDQNKIAYHLTKITGFFAADKRKMLDFVDRDDEVQLWQLYASRLLKNENLEQYKFDKNFLLKISRTFEKEGVFDQLINKETIHKVFSFKPEND